MNRKGVEFNFSWLFAIIAGAVILVSAIYIASQLTTSNRVQSDTLVSGELANLINPVETNLEDSKYTIIKFSQDTRLYNECSAEGSFGVQKISTASKYRNDWSQQSIRKSIYNKYIFSRNVEETSNKKLNVLVDGIELPFKVGDAIIIYSGNYCFVNPSSEIEERINDLSLSGKQNIGINITQTLNNCPLNSTKVCFNRRECDVNVDTIAQTVSKNGNTVYYSEDLILSAILSDYNIYECQVKRLVKRASELSAIYAKKANYVEGSGCSNNLASDLNNFVISSNISTSREFARTIVPIAEDLERRNRELGSCKIF